MKSVEPTAIRDVLLLALASGSSDATGFMGLAHVFTSNMTGNLVLLGFSIGQGDLIASIHSAFVIVLFVCGVALGIGLWRGAPENNWGGYAWKLLLLQKFLLVSFAVGWVLAIDHHTGYGTYALLGTLALAMGLQSAALTRLGAPGVGTSAITGTITALVASVITTVAEPKATSGGSERIRFQAGVVSIYALGAACSGFLLLHVEWLAGCIPALAAIFVWPRSSPRAD